MSTELTIRPRLRFISPLEPDALADTLAAYFNENQRTYFGYVVKHHAVLQQHDHEVHLWSPRLEVDIEAHENGSLARGLIAPRPGVWSLLLFGYATFGLAAFFLLIMGLANIPLDKPLWPLYAAFGCLLGILGVYLIAQGGKRVMRGEMEEMKVFFVNALGEGIEEDVQES